MTDPKRLLAEGSEEERQLLQAASAEEPPADGAKRVAMALGLGAATLGTAASAKASGGALSKLLGAKFALKAGLVLGAGAALALALAARAPNAPDVSIAARSRGVPSAPGPSPQPEPRESEAQAPAHAPISIADEVARLDAVRRALSARQPDQALAALTDYQRSYPRGSLLPEAARLRIEAWLAKGDVARARALARDFLRTYPESPHTAALKPLAEGRGQRDPHDEEPRTP